jgi:hypothetical protein
MSTDMVVSCPIKHSRRWLRGDNNEESLENEEGRSTGQSLPFLAACLALA